MPLLQVICDVRAGMTNKNAATMIAAFCVSFERGGYLA
jgi:hypothetical protein